MIFHVHNTSGVPLRHTDGTPLNFTDGKKAASWAEHETRLTGIKHRAVRFFQETDWKARERSRMESGEYLPLSWAQEAWWKAMEIPDHYAHVAKKKQGLIAYTESHEKGLADIQQACKPGTYLSRFFSDKLGPARIADLSAHHNAVYDGSEFFITRNPDEIEHVYLNGPTSCMKRPLSDFSSRIHPARLYGEPGDLGLAYVVCDDRITARAVVWPDKKCFNTIYGDYTKLEFFLRKEGYKQASLEGARLPKIPHEGNGPNMFVVPWIDGARCAKVEDEWIILAAAGDLPCDTSCGVSTRMMPIHCDNCSTLIPPRGVTYVHLHPEAREEARRWCITCRTSHAFVCAGTGSFFANSTGPIITPYARRTFSQYWRNNLAICEKSGQFEESEHIVEVCIAYGPARRTIQRWSGAFCTPEFVFQDQSDGRWYINELRSGDNPLMCKRNYEKGHVTGTVSAHNLGADSWPVLHLRTLP